MKIIKQPSNVVAKWFLIIVTASLLLATFFVGVATAMHFYYQDKYIIGAKVANYNAGGQNKTELHTNLQKIIDDFHRQGITLNYQGKIINIPTVLTTQKLDTVQTIINFKLEETLDQLWRLGHGNGYLTNFWQQLTHLFSPRNYNLIITSNEPEIKKIITENWQKFETTANDAKPVITNNEITISDHNLGMEFDYDKIISNIKKTAQQLKKTPIDVDLILSFPEIEKEDISEEDINKLTDFWKQKNTLTLKNNNKDWDILPQTYQEWFVFKKNENEIKIAFDDVLLEKYLNDNIATEINVEPANAKFNIKDGRVTEFQSSHDGKKVNIDNTINIINDKFFSQPEEYIEVVVTEIKANLSVADTNDMGIREIIGVGKSNFSGSPPNRIHNIKTGAASLNGLIIKPGETFSLIDALGDIDAAHGYLPELVIKGDKTVPEYGGGLCQIGTTTFRTAIDTGLPIVERRNHSYRVSYYEPAGTDATIYDPKPDFRFTNDTDNNILIQTRMEGYDLIFEFWGSDDGRSVYYSEPRIYNITKPGPTKYIETTELEPGKIKCTEKPHNGADAEFDYEVTYKNGEKMEETFFSHYVAWPEVCMKGIEPKEDETSDTENKNEKNTTTNDG